MRELVNFVLMPLTFIGALNWGLVGLFGFNLVTFLCGQGTILTNIVYSLVGIAALICLIWMLADRPATHSR